MARFLSHRPAVLPAERFLAVFRPNHSQELNNYSERMTRYKSASSRAAARFRNQAKSGAVRIRADVS
jgi:hypothetical protein